MAHNHKHILYIDKPAGITSFDVIRILRKKFKKDETLNASRRVKMGHAGTLDPMATGLMLIGVGEGTKELSHLLKLPKTYEAEILLGVQTDTGDVTGKTMNRLIGDQLTGVKDEEIEKVVDGMVGELKLPVPAYSAIKQGGEPLYKKARRGEKVETPIRTMIVSGVRDISVWHEGDTLKVRATFDVGSGTYIRSLAEELGRRLGVPATLSALRRTRIGEYDIKNAKTIY